MTSSLRITTGRATNGVPRLSAVGEIDLTNSFEFRQALDDAVKPDARLLVDLTQVDYLDSAALAALFAHADDIDIHIAPLNESLFTICGLTDITNVQVIRATPATPDTSASPD